MAGLHNDLNANLLRINSQGLFEAVARAMKNIELPVMNNGKIISVDVGQIAEAIKREVNVQKLFYGIKAGNRRPLVSGFPDTVESKKAMDETIQDIAEKIGKSGWKGLEKIAGFQDMSLKDTGYFFNLSEIKEGTSTLKDSKFSVPEKNKKDVYIRN